MKETILITGAGGLIGSILRQELQEKYELRLLSQYPIEGTESIVADVNDFAAVRAACENVSYVIHLAANVSPWASWEEVLQSNIIGTYNVFEAAHQAGVKQVLFASSNHVVGGKDQQHAPEIYRTGLPLIDHLTPVQPDGLYGVSKCFGEALGRYYVDTKGLRVHCLRIGCLNPANDPFAPPNLPPDAPKESPERLAAIWLSHRDLVQLVEKSLAAEQLNYAILYGISNNRPHFYDLEHTRALIGYEPLDGVEVRLACHDKQ